MREKKEKYFENIRLSHAKKFICCALTIRCNIYSMAGRFIASISDLGGIFTSVLRASGHIYRQWTSLPYDIYYIITLIEYFIQFNSEFMCTIRATGAILVKTCALGHYGV